MDTEEMRNAYERVTMPEPRWTPTNRELQERICALIGLDFQSCQQVTIKLTLHGTVEVDAQFYAGTYKPTEPATKKNEGVHHMNQKQSKKKNA